MSVFTPTPEAKAQATKFRIIALMLWVLAIALELMAIFWVMRPPFDQLVEHQGFPPSRWWILIALLVIIGLLSIGGSLLWKRSNRLDPASRKDTFRFFVQNQLGAIIAIVAFLPLIVMIFLNKDMDEKQKGIAGAVGIVMALTATYFGIDFKPFSTEQAAVESQVVTQLVGEDKVWWTESGKVAHLCADASDIANSATKQSGTTAEFFAAGTNKEGITLKLSQELRQCDLSEPEDLDAIVDWVRSARGEKVAERTTAE